MNTLHQYEDWLDTLDKQLRVEGSHIVCDLGSKLIIPLEVLRSAEDVVLWGSKLQECLAKSESNLPNEYLIKRFAKLAKEKAGLAANADEIAWEVLVGYRRT